MAELLRIVEEPRQCSYLAGQRASLEYRLVVDLSPGEYGELLSRGFRRFGQQIFRPACPRCRKCVSLRVRLRDYRPNRSQKRTLAANEGVRAIRGRPAVTPEHLELYNRYHEFMSDRKGWLPQRTTRRVYHSCFVQGGAVFGRQWLFYKGEKLVGVALSDEVPKAISLVYFYHDPEWRRDGPGTCSIVTQLLDAQERGLDYAYLGYQIDDCTSMSYKSAFRPHELLESYPADDASPNWAVE